MTATLTAVCLGRVQRAAWAGRLGRTAIHKRPVAAPVLVRQLGLDGDEQADQEHHGGRDKAVYAYGQDDADHWVGALGRELPPGAFGENLRIAGLDVSAARVGERWRIGDQVVVEVSGPRIPCQVFAGFWDVPDLISRFIAAGRPGAYLRVLEQGVVTSGDRVQVVERPEHEVTVAEVLRVRTGAPDEAASLLAAGDALPTGTRQWVEDRLRLGLDARLDPRLLEG